MKNLGRAGLLASIAPVGFLLGITIAFAIDRGTYIYRMYFGSEAEEPV